MSRTHESPTILLTSRRVLTAVLLLGTTLLVLGSPALAGPALRSGTQPAAAQQAPSTVPGATVAPGPGPSEPQAATPPVDVIEVSGYVDAIQADFIERSIEAAVESGAQLLVIQLNSPGAIITQQKLDELAFRMGHAEVPIGVWVGPNGSRAFGGAVRLVRAAATSGMATGTDIGRFRGECPLCPSDDPLLTTAILSSEEALRAQAVDTVAPTLGDFIIQQDGRVLGDRQLSTARVVFRDTPRREPIAQVRFAKLTLTQRVLHSMTSPELAYMLLMIGLLLILFEFYSAGIGVAGVTGAVALILACYGLAALGPNAVALVLIGLALFGFAVDVQAGVPRTWTAIGTVALALGSWLLFPGDRRVGWPALVIVLAGTLLFVLRGMTVMVRSRFSTPVIRRDAMVGREGAVATALDPDGLVDLGGGRWRARTTRAGSSMGIGSPVRVVAVDGLVLEVEPAPAARAAPPAVGSQGD